MVAEYCFPKNNRLCKPDEFTTVYRENQHRAKGQYFIVLAFSRFQSVDNGMADDTIRQSSMPARVGVVVSKKVSKAAVRRNRIKRLMRESFRHLINYPDDIDFVVIAKPAADAASNEQLTKELTYLWKKIRQRCAVS